MAWAAGVFDAWGGIASEGPKVRLSSVDLAILDRFQRTVRLGKVYGPYGSQQSDGHERKPFYVWTAPVDESRLVFEMLRPWLSSRKVERAEKVGLLKT